jgi:type I restriction enzyme S subunit
MSFPRYPKYKDSGVEWLGAVPEHWSVKRIGYYFNERREKVSDKDFPALSVTKNGIVPQLDTAAKSDDGDNRKKVSKGDFVINSRSDRKGSAGVSALDGSVSLICTVLRPQEQVDAPFVHHLLRCQPFQEEFYRYGKGIVADLWSTNYSEMRNILLGMPPLPEQSQIAAFLDRETAKIDELLAEQRRLMELLKEKRQAVISHAVTQGLNPDAPMKPSGIEWLGDVPEHWDSTPIKYVAKVGNGSTPSREVPEYWAETGFPWLNSSVVNASVVTEAEGFVTERALRECHLPIIAPPAILVGITGQGRTRGMAAMLGIEATINQHVAYVRPNTSELDVRYLLRILESAYLKLRRDSEEAGATKGAITCEQLGNLHVPLPPLAEQSAISAFLDIEAAKLDTLTAEAQRAIDLLQERRTALISAAVTGQIDVRTFTERKAA